MSLLAARAEARPRSEPPSPAQALAGVLQRMGDVLGPGAIYSLVRYGAYEEGLALAAHGRPASAKAAVDDVARIMGLDARLTGDRPLVVEFGAEPEIAFASRGIVALLVGLLEALMTTALGSKVQALREPSITRTGALRIELTR